MVRFEFHPTTKNVRPIKETSTPYIKVRIDSIDKSWMHHSHFPDWTRSATCEQFNYNNEAWIGVTEKTTAKTVDLTKTIDLPSDGHYRIEIMMAEGPSDKGTLQLFDGTKQIGNTYLAATTMPDMKQRIQFPVQYLAKGNHNFKVTLNSRILIAWIVIFKINRFEGGTQHVNDATTKRLDIIDGSFTQNTISSSNLLNLKVIMKDEYYDDKNPRSLMKFDYNDHITLWLGSDYTDSTPMFGGYITDLSVNEANTELTIGCEDRLFDLKRKPLYKKFKMGNATVNTDTSAIPFTVFADAYSLINAVAQTPEYPIATYGVPYDYGFKRTFQTLQEYNDISSTVFRTEWDTTQGDPKPSLKIGIQDNSGTGKVVLYQSDVGWDAAVYNHFNFSYYTGGAGSRYPLPFNIELDMYKDNDTSTKKTYTIHANGTSIADNILTSFEPLLDGAWHDITFNLKTLFDKLAPSTNYWITEIRLVGTVSTDMLTSRRCSTIWIDKILSYREIISIADHATQDVNTAYNEIKTVCDDCNLMAYVQYGEERRDDILMVQPVGNTVVPETADEGSNILSVPSWTYSPLDDGFYNQAYNTFNVSSDKSSSSYVEDHDSVLLYGAYQNTEQISSTMPQQQADTYTKNQVSIHAWKNFGSTIVIPGCVILQPSQFMLTQVGTMHISGQQQIKTIKHDFKLQDTISYTTTIELNRSGIDFNKYLQGLSKDIRNNGTRNSVQGYINQNIYGETKTGAGVWK